MTQPMPPRNWRTRTLTAADEQLVADVAAALEPCTHPASMLTYHSTRSRTITMCHRPGCGHIIADTAAGLCRVPYILTGNPDRVALCGLERGHPEPDHQESPQPGKDTR